MSNSKPVNPALIRAATLADHDALQRICHDTVLAGHAPDVPLQAHSLPGDLYAVPYLHAPGALGLVCEDTDGVVGYAVGASDSAAFYAWMNRIWLPPKRALFPSPKAGADALPALAASLIARLHTDWHAPAAMQDFPAHLHINLLPRAQGKGAGRQLIHALLANLAEAGAGGVHWGVDPANTGALAFYRKSGFVVKYEEPGCAWFAAALPIVAVG